MILPSPTYILDYSFHNLKFKIHAHAAAGMPLPIAHATATH
jgi:hypothetical protein